MEFAYRRFEFNIAPDPELATWELLGSVGSASVFWLPPSTNMTSPMKMESI